MSGEHAGDSAAGLPLGGRGNQSMPVFCQELQPAKNSNHIISSRRSRQVLATVHAHTHTLNSYRNYVLESWSFLQDSWCYCAMLTESLHMTVVVFGRTFGTWELEFLANLVYRAIHHTQYLYNYERPYWASLFSAWISYTTVPESWSFWQTLYKELHSTCIIVNVPICCFTEHSHRQEVVKLSLKEGMLRFIVPLQKMPHLVAELSLKGHAGIYSFSPK